MGSKRSIFAVLRGNIINYYPFHIGDYVSATRHLSWEEDAAYRRLLDTYYITEKPLPVDIRQVFRLVLATTESQREAVEIVLGEFFQLTDEGYVSDRAEREIAAMQGKQQKQREKANKRWDMQRAELGNASAMPQHKTNDATALNTDANGMPPTPTPTPTPVLNTTAKAVGASRRKAQTQLPGDFQPNEAGTEAARLKNIDVQAELAKFRNYHEAKASVMADWQAAWRTWIGNARAGNVISFGAKPNDDDFMRANKHAPWVLAAGFANIWEAHNNFCFEHTAHEFRDGKRIKAAP